MFLKGNATKGKTDKLMDDVSFAKTYSESHRPSQHLFA